jgi:hypothetical protein
MTFLLVFAVGTLLVAGCATLGIDTKEKSFLLVQKEVNEALQQYKVQLFTQDAATQALWHKTYDAPIKAMSAALDAWQEVVMGLTGDVGQLEEFKRIKNELILLGWNYFSKEVD